MRAASLLLSLALLPSLGGCGAFRFFAPAHPLADERQQLTADFLVIHGKASQVVSMISLAAECAALPGGDDCDNAGEQASLTPRQFAKIDDKLSAVDKSLDEAETLFNAFRRAGQSPDLALDALEAALGSMTRLGAELTEDDSPLRIAVPVGVAAALALLELERSRLRRVRGQE